MQAEQIQLVIPATLQSSYRDEQRTWLMSVADFITVVSDRERISRDAR
jgi:hypothetical protein